MPVESQDRRFGARQLPDTVDTIAPDGSEVRILLSLAAGSSAHFRLDAGATSRAGHHRTVEEIWYILEGQGEMWRRSGNDEEVIGLRPGLCLTIPLGTSFQFRATCSNLSAFAVTIPAWPGDSGDEWVEVPPHWPIP
ncbi:MAG: hypothetical protein OXF74_01260 [Rhodobacteraceae bacterium]|nr:hypothetical protein [Paracoccaceae bacterium]